MTKKKLAVVGLGTLCRFNRFCTCELKKGKIKSLRRSEFRSLFYQESMLKYQAKKNEDFDDRLNALVDEIGSVYEHLEYVEIKKDEK